MWSTGTGKSQISSVKRRSEGRAKRKLLEQAQAPNRAGATHGRLLLSGAAIRF
jgi:hypothetical protein